MSSVIISGDTSGAITVSAPLVAGTNTLTLLAATATNSVNTLGTVNAGGTNPFPSSGGPTVVDFTGLPSWIKRITVMFSGVSGSASSNMLIQIGAGSITSTGYISASSFTATTTNITPSTAGFVVWRDSASYAFSGHMLITNITSNTWVASHTGTLATNVNCYGGGNVSLGGALDRVRITTVNGTDLFDAGSVNILYEG
jgi:hypothetical protein